MANKHKLTVVARGGIEDGYADIGITIWRG